MKHKYLLWIAFFAVLAIFAASCSKEDKTAPVLPGENQQEQDNNQPEEVATLIASWTMDLEKSYTSTTKYDDKKGVDVITGATGGEGGGEGGEGDGGDIPEGGRVTYMSTVYSAASLSFDTAGVATRSYTRNGSTTTSTYPYTKSGNVVKFADTRFYIVSLTKSTLVLESSRVYMAKGKDVYYEFMHLVYNR